MTLTEALAKLKEAQFTISGSLAVEVWVNPEPVPFEKRFSGNHKLLKEGDSWGTLFDAGWFHFTGILPKIPKKTHPVLLLDVNGEMLLYTAKGLPLRGLTSKASTFDRTLGEPVKKVFYLPPDLSAGDKIDYWGDAGCNDLFGELKENGTLKQAAIAFVKEDIRKLFYDFEFLLNLEKCSWEAPEQGSPFTISAIGHSHLDLAWLWPLRETRRKIGRTLATVFTLMERYPGYVYGISQPRLLGWVKKDYPFLFEKLKEFIQEGRIELLGAMWVESDTNIPSGESMVRQIIYGKKFWSKEFRAEVNTLWLPDTFGFSASLPQIMEKSGITSLITMKLSWNRVNRFPYHSFWWKGIDGTRVLVHMLPEGTYNSPALPQSAAKIESEYRERNVSSHALMVYGIGDGGGGPGAEHLERLKRMGSINKLLHVKQEKVESFLGNLEKESDGFPTWEGELYLERHQGTFTTNGKSKFYNEQMEVMLFKTEFLSVLGLVFLDIPYPKKEIDSLWREMLLYQFHDILPGTSIKRVYKESWDRYRKMVQVCNKIIRELPVKLAALFSGNPLIKGTAVPSSNLLPASRILAFNFLPWKTTEWVASRKGWAEINVPAMGFTLMTPDEGKREFPELKCCDKKIENDLLILSFDSKGSIISLYDREAGREVIQKKKGANVFTVFPDPGDAWDFDPEYRKKGKRITPVKRDSFVKGPYLYTIQLFTFRESRILQEIRLTSGSRRIDFTLKIEWHEEGTMLRVSFPLNIPGGRAFCGSAFGAVERPVKNTTSRDRAKDEVPVQGWADISTGSYGASLISPAKYGYRVKENILDLCLLRSVPFPGSPLLNQGYTDLGARECRYSFLPHRGNYAAGEVVNTARELRYPVLITANADRKMPELKDEFISESFFKISRKQVIISSVKQAESGKGLIIRLYESSGLPVKARLHVHPRILTLYPCISEVNLLEVFERKISSTDTSAVLDFTPYEIKTILLAAKEN